MTDACRALLDVAIWAPSGDNMQPWRFVVDDAGRIAVHLDPARDPSPMNSGQRMSRIALGAALENMLRTAERNGWAVQLADEPGDALAVLHVLRADDGKPSEPVVLKRVTNRRPYNGQPVAAAILADLAKQTPPLDSVTTHWVTGRERIDALAPLVGSADATMFGEATMRAAFLGNVRFDATPNAEVEEGLSMASLELAMADRAALRMMRLTPDWMVRCTGARRVFAAKASELTKSSSGLCLVVAPDDAERTDLAVGRAMQRAWLALTAHGLAAQPMSSLPVLENALCHGTPALVEAVGRDWVRALGVEFRQLLPEIGAGRPAFLLRFGYAPAPTGRTGRLPLDKIVKEAATCGFAEAAKTT